MLRYDCSECFKKQEDFEDKDLYMVNDTVWAALGFSDNVVCWSCLNEAFMDKLNRTLTIEDFAQYIDTPLNLDNPEFLKLRGKK